MFQAEVWCGQNGEDVGLGYMWSAGGRRRSGLHVVSGGPRSVPPGESWGCWLLQQL